MEKIYKILRQHEWNAALAGGAFAGSADDLRDGFIHFSSARQVPGTAEKHFADERDLVLLAVDSATLGAVLRWETSRGGEKFPHLYGRLALKRGLWARPLTRDGQGRFVYPGEMD